MTVRLVAISRTLCTALIWSGGHTQSSLIIFFTPYSNLKTSVSVPGAELNADVSGVIGATARGVVVWSSSSVSRVQRHTGVPALLNKTLIERFDVQRCCN